MKLPYRFEFETHEMEAIKNCNEEHGFAIVKNMLDAEYVEALKAEMRRVCDPDNTLKTGESRSFPAYIENAPEFWKLFDNPSFLRLYQYLLDSEEMTIHRSAAILRMPGNIGMAWHSDHSFCPDPPRNANDVLNRGEWPNGAWFYLNGIHPRNGGIAIIPDSHKPDWRGPEGFEFRSNRGSFAKVGEEAWDYAGMDVPGVLPLYSEPGDMLLFAARSYHGVFPHHGDEPRLSCAIIFRPGRSPFTVPWELSPAAHRFKESVPDAMKRFVEFYTGIEPGWRPPTKTDI